jgi:hypothetical protein
MLDDSDKGVYEKRLLASYLSAVLELRHGLVGANNTKDLGVCRARRMRRCRILRLDGLCCVGVSEATLLLLAVYIDSVRHGCFAVGIVVRGGI